MKTNRILIIILLGIASMFVLVLLRKHVFFAEGIFKEADVQTLVEPVPLEAAPIIPKNTQIGELNPAGIPGMSNRLRVNLEAYPQVLDPQKAVLPKEIAFLDLMYEGLTRLDENLAAVPAAAESWMYDQDATGLVFRLRSGLKYSDGSPLNALRFEAALRRLVDPVTASRFAWMVNDIIGAPEWHAADPAAPGYDRQALLSGLGVQAEDLDGNPCTSYRQPECLMLRLEFSQPAPYFHYVMGLWITYPIRLDATEEGIEEWWLRTDQRIGNGPYVLADLDPFVKARFTPNAEYAGEPSKVAIEFSFISDLETALQAYQNNQLEIIDRSWISQDIAEPMLEDEAVVAPGACSSMILFGLKPIAEGQPSPFSDPKVRQAFVLAFDRLAWQRDAEGDKSIYTGSFIPPGFPAHSQTKPIGFDPELARETLAESGYGGPQALNDLGLKLTFLDTPANRLRYAWLADNYRSHLGVEFQLEPLDEAAYAVRYPGQPGPTLLSFETWCGLIPDPHGWLDDYWKDNSPFRPDTGYANPGLEAALAVAGKTTSAPERLELYVQAEKLLVADAPAIFGWVSTNQYLVKPWVKGLVTCPYDSVWPGSKFPERIVVEP